MAPPRKQPDRRQRTNTPSLGLVETIAAVDVPEPDKGWLAATRRDWESFWSSPQAALVMDGDRSALQRLFSYRDEHARALKAYRAERTWTGSTGQTKVSGFLAAAEGLERQITALEDRFGLSPAARLKLGVAFGQAVDSLEAVNRALVADDEADPDDDDPRLRAIDTSAS